MNRLTVKAYAKINLGLRVLNKREDGYHNIETIFHPINVYDELTFEECDDVKLSCSDASLPINDDNLCIRAVKLLHKRYKFKRGIRIGLTKNIPIGAGLGGGSSDAAATLKTLNLHWNLKIPDDTLALLALQLGSDVPYFLGEGSAYATGRGEKLEPLPCTLPFWIVIVYPNIHISTEWAYANVQSWKEKDSFTLRYIFTNYHDNLQMLAKLLKNDFEQVVAQSHPKITDLFEALKFWGAKLVQLSGSGSSVYGLFTSKANVDKFIRKADSDYKVFVTPPNFKIEK